MARKQIDLTNLQPLIDKLHDESDRACAVLAVSTVDLLLENLLRTAMLPEFLETLFEGNGPLRSFSAKIDLAYSMGLIGAEEHRDLHLVRKIRNDFAHDIDYNLSFASPAVADRIKAFGLLKMVEGQPVLSQENDTPHWRFQLCVGALFLYLRNFRMKHVKAPARPTALKFPRQGQG